MFDVRSISAPDTRTARSATAGDAMSWTSPQGGLKVVVPPLEVDVEQTPLLFVIQGVLPVMERW